MFTPQDVPYLEARPFVPFRVHLDDGSVVEMRHRNLMLLGYQFAIVGLQDPGTMDDVADRFISLVFPHRPSGMPRNRNAAVLAEHPV